MTSLALRLTLGVLCIAATAAVAGETEEAPVSVSVAAERKPQSEAAVRRAEELKQFLAKEKPHFEAREAQKRDVAEALDRLNSDQNSVRRRLADIALNQQELGMALDNLAMEVEKGEKLEATQRERVFWLLKLVYRIKKDGMLRFVVNGSNLTELAGRVRVVYRTLRSHSFITQQLKDRADRLEESERKLSAARQESQRLVEELKEQERLLSELLTRKHRMLKQIGDQQNSYQVASREYKRVSSQLATLFNNFEAVRQPTKGTFPSRKTLPLPVTSGRLVKTFGKSVHEKFRTVTLNKGIEIEGTHEQPVHAVMDGIVEYEGWVKGLGNVLIVHHGNGFYSLSAHLFKSMQPRGSKVKQGDTIALVGDTGNSDKPSLYFELRENGKAVDPLRYFAPDAVKTLSHPAVASNAPRQG